MEQRLAEAFYSFKRDQDEKGAILSYSGFVSESILFSLGETLRRRVEHEENDLSHTKRLFSVFVEQVQNVIRYSCEKLPPRNTKEMPLGSGLILVGMEAESFFVLCANTVTFKQKEQLQARLTTLASMDKDTLRGIYRKKLKEPPEEGSLGGSIGLIEVARRSSRPLEFDFFDLADQRSFFCLKVYV